MPFEETGPATGWFGRAQRLLERDGRDCVEQGYLLLPLAEQNLAAANGDVAYATATSAAEIGERFGDADLIACARHLQGRSLIQQGQVEQGLALLDEAMVAARVARLRRALAMHCSIWKVIALDEGDTLGVMREHPRGQQASGAASQNDGVSKAFLLS